MTRRMSTGASLVEEILAIEENLRNPRKDRSSERSTASVDRCRMQILSVIRISRMVGQDLTPPRGIYKDKGIAENEWWTADLK